jgi:hypothetical protein
MTDGLRLPRACTKPTGLVLAILPLLASCSLFVDHDEGRTRALRPITAGHRMIADLHWRWRA